MKKVSGKTKSKTDTSKKVTKKTPAVAPKKKTVKSAVVSGPVLPKVVVLPPMPPHSESALPVEPPKKKRRRRIKRKEGKTDPSKMYFNMGTQDAIVEHQKCTNKVEKDAIYLTKIMPAFITLVENLMNVHKFNVAGADISVEEIKNDCVTFLYESIHKYDVTRGSAAFSYFNVVAKNWLIIKTKQKATKTKRFVSVDEQDDMSMQDLAAIDNYQSSERLENTTPHGFIKEKIILMMKDFLKTNSSNDNEELCAKTIIHIFESIEDLDLLNKNAVMYYMRELSGLNSKQLVVSLQAIRKKYKTEKADFFI